MLRNIWKARELLLTLTRRDLIVRYQSSVLGFLWSFARPLALVVIFHVAFKIILKIRTPNEQVPFSLHLLVGVLAWSFVARCVGESHWAVLSHANLIKKIKLPIEVFPATVLTGNLINYLMEMVAVFPIVLLVMAGDQGVVLTGAIWRAVACLALTGLLAMLAFSLALIVSAINVFYRDMESLSEVGLLGWFYATPIVYPVSLVGDLFLSRGYPAWLETLYWLNPMTPICAGFRRVLLYSPQDGLEVPDGILFFYLAIACLTVLALYAAAQAIFRHYARLFADEV